MINIHKNNLIFVGTSDTIDLINNSRIVYKNQLINDINILGYISHKREKHSPYKSFKFLGNDFYLKKKSNLTKYIVNNIYSNQSRKKIFEISKKSNYLPVSVIFKNATLFSNIKIGDSNIIYPNVTISTNSSINTGNVIGYDTLIGHNVKIGKFNFIGPGCKILGEAKIGNNCLIGSNVKIMPQVKIGNNVNINAGLTIHHNIESNNSLIITKNFRMIKN